MIIYGLLIPLTIVDGIFMGLFSHLTAINHNWWLWWGLVATNIIPIEAGISLLSKKSAIVFNILLYNASIMGAYLITVSLLKSATSGFFWLGLVIAFIGFVLMKLTWEEKTEKQEGDMGCGSSD